MDWKDGLMPLWQLAGCLAGCSTIGFWIGWFVREVPARSTGWPAVQSAAVGGLIGRLAWQLVTSPVFVVGNFMWPTLPRLPKGRKGRRNANTPAWVNKGRNSARDLSQTTWLFTSPSPLLCFHFTIGFSHFPSLSFFWPCFSIHRHHPAPFSIIPHHLSIITIFFSLSFITTYHHLVFYHSSTFSFSLSLYYYHFSLVSCEASLTFSPAFSFILSSFSTSFFNASRHLSTLKMVVSSFWLFIYPCLSQYCPALYSLPFPSFAFFPLLISLIVSRAFLTRNFFLLLSTRVSLFRVRDLYQSFAPKLLAPGYV